MNVAQRVMYSSMRIVDGPNCGIPRINICAFSRCIVKENNFTACTSGAIFRRQNNFLTWNSSPIDISAVYDIWLGANNCHPFCFPMVNDSQSLPVSWRHVVVTYTFLLFLNQNESPRSLKDWYYLCVYLYVRRYFVYSRIYDRCQSCSESYLDVPWGLKQFWPQI